jgi:hypothetical protein
VPAVPSNRANAATIASTWAVGSAPLVIITFPFIDFNTPGAPSVRVVKAPVPRVNATPPQFTSNGNDAVVSAAILRIEIVLPIFVISAVAEFTLTTLANVLGAKHPPIFVSAGNVKVVRAAIVDGAKQPEIDVRLVNVIAVTNAIVFGENKPPIVVIAGNAKFPATEAIVFGLKSPFTTVKSGKAADAKPPSVKTAIVVGAKFPFIVVTNGNDIDVNKAIVDGANAPFIVPANNGKLIVVIAGNVFGAKAPLQVVSAGK